MTQHKRRDFLKTLMLSGAGVALTNSGVISPLVSTAHASQLQMDNSGFKALVCVNLGGGNDASNTIVPTSSDEYGRYSQLRQNLALPSNKLLALDLADQSYGLHPELKQLQGLFNQGDAAAVANVGSLIRADGSVGGTPKRSSHSNQTTYWKGVDPTRASIDKAGWLDRLQQHSDDFKIIHNTQPIEFLDHGDSDLKEVALGIGLDSQLNGGLFSQEVGNRILEAKSYAADMNEQLNRSDVKEAISSLTTPFPNTNIGRQLEEIAQAILIRDWLGVSRLSFRAHQGGYDEHSNHVKRHAKLLKELDAAIYAFHQAMEQWGLGQQVTLYTSSEFGRTTTSNGTGSAHGWGGHHFVIGGAVNGQQIVGRMPEMSLASDDMVSEKGILKPQLAIDQYLSTLGLWFGIAESSLDLVLPHSSKFTVRDLDFMVS